MNGYFLLRPSVYGQMGIKTEWDRTVSPPQVSSLHFVLDCDPLDDLHKSSPCFLVSRTLAERIAKDGFTGATIEGVLAEYDKQYLEREPDAVKPDLRLLRPTGKAGSADFGLNEERQLVVSERAMSLLKQFRISNCRVYDDTSTTFAQMKVDTLAEIRKSLDKARAAKRR